MVCKPVDKAAEVLAEFTRYANKGKRSPVAEMLAPFLVVSKALLPHLAKICIDLGSLVHSGIKDSYAGQHKYLMLEIGLQLRLLYLVKMEG